MPTTAQTDLDEQQRAAVLRTFNDFRGPLERYAAHLLGGDHARGQDIAQDTFQRLLQQPPEERQRLMDSFLTTDTAATGERSGGVSGDHSGGRSGGRSGGGGGGGGRLKAWLFTVCRNRALDVRRKERRMTPLTAPLADAQHAAEPGPAEQTQRDDTHAAVLRRMADLPGNQQEVLRLRFQGELTYPQIAEVTGLTVGNVGYLLHHGLKTLRQQLA